MLHASPAACCATDSGLPCFRHAPDSQLDAKTRSLIGLGVKPSNGTLERTLVRLDPVSHSYTTVGDIPAWLVESGGESALDTFSRTLYWIGQPTGAKPTDPFHLVGLNADTGAVVSSPLLCATDAACPWSIGVSNE